MLFKNTLPRSEITIPREDGKGTGLIVPVEGHIDGSSRYLNYEKYGLVRVAGGFRYDMISGAPSTLQYGRTIIINGFQAAQNDVDYYDGILTNGNYYTAVGRIYWTDANGDWQIDFSVTGSGTHGSGAVFTFSNAPAGCAVNPINTNSSINTSVGSISIEFSGPPTNVKIDLCCDFEPVSESLHYGPSPLSVFNLPETITTRIFVTNGDIGANYHSSSVGQVKEERVVAVGSQVGSKCKQTVYLYRNDVTPIQASHIKVRIVQSVANDYF